MEKMIKFRVWDHEEECFNEDSSFWIYQSGEIDHDYKDRGREITIQQYTGLKDKKKREIYEGDICKVDGQDYLEEFYISSNPIVTRIRQHNKEIANRYPCVDTNQYEVIGNIFENPELLNNDSN